MKTWKSILDEESNKDYYIQLADFIKQDALKHIIYPAHKNIFRALTFTPLDKIKVVILGQDPYHGHGQANGLAFSVSPEIKIPPSLLNIFKEIKSDLNIPIPNHGDLTSLAQQGVLFLNSILTVREGEAGSHKNKGWEQLTDRFICEINQIDKPIVYLLWGAFAHNKSELITNTKHLVLKEAHPSPLSAHKGFFGCKHFSQCNDYLIANGESPIDWSLSNI